MAVFEDEVAGNLLIRGEDFAVDGIAIKPIKHKYIILRDLFFVKKRSAKETQ